MRLSLALRGAAAALALMFAIGPAGRELAHADVSLGMQMGVDMPGNDIASQALGAPDPGLCRAACDANGQCVGWTFVKPGVQGPGAVCWLKRQWGATRRDPNVIAARKGAPAAAGPASVSNAMLVGVNFAGSDIANMALQRPDPSLCQQACDANGQCRAWTFVKPGVQRAEAVCWLKNATPAQNPDEGVISGLRQVVMMDGSRGRPAERPIAPVTSAPPLVVNPQGARPATPVTSAPPLVVYPQGAQPRGPVIGLPSAVTPAPK